MENIFLIDRMNCVPSSSGKVAPQAIEEIKEKARNQRWKSR